MKHRVTIELNAGEWEPTQGAIEWDDRYGSDKQEAILDFIRNNHLTFRKVTEQDDNWKSYEGWEQVTISLSGDLCRTGELGSERWNVDCYNTLEEEEKEEGICGECKHNEIEFAVDEAVVVMKGIGKDEWVKHGIEYDSIDWELLVETVPDEEVLEYANKLLEKIGKKTAEEAK